MNHNGNKVRVEAALGPVVKIGDQTGRSATVSSRKKMVNGVKITLFPNNIDSYDVSLSPHVSQHKLGKLSKIFTFYRHIVGASENGWLHSESLDSILVTNKAEFNREIDKVVIATGTEGCLSRPKITYDLQDLLLHGGCEASELRTLLTSPGASDISENAPLAILDGLNGLRELDRVNTLNVVVILNQHEYNEECEELIKRYSRCRDNSLMPEIPESLNGKNNGINIMGFALPNGE